ncbi:MAG TPA: FAD binding domain-containing protein [Bacilli bacterium]|nr:FAD binding domain-containing protein [Bacilli bacterium]
MISFDFDYERPGSLVEAVQLFLQAEEQGRLPLYFGGGTEIITLARIEELYTEAVLDVKCIPGMRALQVTGERIVTGAALSLNEVVQANVYPLLSATAGKIADHNSRNKITLGGNLCGRIIYREAVLPLLVADSEVVLAGPSGLRIVPLRSVFDRTMRLEKGELLVQIHTPVEAATASYAHVRKNQLEEIDYPLVTVSALWLSGRIRMAVSGLLPYPFRSEEVEAALNGDGSVEARVEEAVRRLPEPVMADIRASSAYREHVFRVVLMEILEAWEAEGGEWGHEG